MSTRNTQPPPGWLPFGSLIDYHGPAESSTETDEAGIPLRERPLTWTLNHGICPSCEEFKFVGHGPLCTDCFATPGGL